MLMARKYKYLYFGLLGMYKISYKGLIWILGENLISFVLIRVCEESGFNEEYSTIMDSIYTTRFALHF